MCLKPNLLQNTSLSSGELRSGSKSPTSVVNQRVEDSSEWSKHNASTYSNEKHGFEQGKDVNVSAEAARTQSCPDPTLATAPHTPTRTLAEIIEPRFWSIVTLAALAASAPLVISITLAVAAVYGLFHPYKAVPSNGKTVIVTGGKMTKSMVLVRQLKEQGCRVVLVETSKYWMVASRFSRCVDRFVTVPVPEKQTKEFLAAIGQLAREEKADLYIPVTSPVASQYEALVASVLPEGCHSWSLPPGDVEDLDDKVRFCQSAEALGLTVPTSQRVCKPAEARAFNERLLGEQRRDPSAKQTRYIFKSIFYDSMHRLDLFTLPCAPAKLDAYLADLSISEQNPWILQTFVTGEEYSTCAFVNDGRMLAFSDNAASISCFNYLPARNSKLREWVRTFCAARKLSGIVCIDFIVDADGTPYAIECNPRASSNITAFYNHPGLGSALLHPTDATSTVEPLNSAVETYWLFAEAWYTVAKPGRSVSTILARVAELLRTVVCKKDAYFMPHDPLPSLALLFVHLPTLLVRNLYTGNRWAKIDPCIGKLTEENGD